VLIAGEPGRVARGAAGDLFGPIQAADGVQLQVDTGSPRQVGEYRLHVLQLAAGSHVERGAVAAGRTSGRGRGENAGQRQDDASHPNSHDWPGNLRLPASVLGLADWARAR